MTIIELKNDFHNTSVRVRQEVLWHGVEYSTRLTVGQWARVRRTLCGLSECYCGGLPGRQEFGGKKLIVETFPK